MKLREVKSCEVKSFAEQRPDIVPANSSLSTRAGKWTVGQAVEGHSVSSMSRTLKCDWDTANKALNHSRAEGDDNGSTKDSGNDRVESDDNSRAESDDNDSTDDNDNADGG